MSQPQPQPKQVAMGLLINPVVQWALGLFALYLVLRFVVPDLFSGIKKAFGGVTDSVLSALSNIVRAPESQELSKRTAADQVKGLVTEGDRSLSDLVDEPTTFLKKVFGVL